MQRRLVILALCAILPCAAWAVLSGGDDTSPVAITPAEDEPAEIAPELARGEVDIADSNESTNERIEVPVADRTGRAIVGRLLAPDGPALL